MAAKTKGTNLADMVKFLRTRDEEARKLLAPRLHHYLDGALSVAAWYPEADMIELVRVLAQLLPVPDGEDPLVHIGRVNARMHLHGTYAHLLRDSEPSRLPVRAVALWRSMHDTGELRLTVEDLRAEASLAGYGHPTPEMCVMLGAYLQELFTLAGVRDVAVEEQACSREGAPACRFEMTWPAQE